MIKITATPKLTAALLLAAPLAHGQRLFTITPGNEVNIVDAGAPGTVLQSGAVTGLFANESILGLDYRANGGGIFAISDQNNVYQIDQNTFAASQIGGTLAPPLNGIDYAIDFNPAFNGGVFFRVISNTDKNRVVDSTTGGYLAPVEKTPVFYADGDPNLGQDPNIQGIAYSNNVSGATSTQQFGIDTTLGILATVANNAGTLNTIGSLGISNLTDEAGFDIDGDSGIAYAILQVSGGFSNLYSINTATGAATPIGVVGNGLTVRDFTVIPIPEPSSAALLGLAALGLCRRKR